MSARLQISAASVSKKSAVSALFQHWPARVLALAAAYFIFGKLGLLLAVPPGYATAVWPPSGVALAGLLLLGGRCWPGVWLGSFCVNVGMSFDASSTEAIWRSLAIAASIGLGASLQAAAGAWLVRRFIGWPAPLIRNCEILSFLCLGGPAGCLVGATWGVGTLWLAGVVPASAWLMNWGTWWVGDTIGVWIFATIGLIALAHPREVWRQRWQSVALPLAVSFATAVGVFWLVEKNENTRLHATFAQQAQEQVNRFGYATHVHSVVLRDLVNLFAASEQVTREEFDNYARGAMKSDPRIAALAWVPRLPDEASTTRSRGEEHFFVLAADGNPMSRIFLADSETVRIHAMQRARDLGRDTATSPILTAEGKERAFIIFVPFYGRGADEALRSASDGAPPAADLVVQRRERLQGYVAGVFDVENLVRDGFGDTAFNELQLRIHDVTERAEGELVFTTGGAGRESAGDYFRRGWFYTVNVGERTWRLQFTPTLEYLARHQSIGAWSVLAGAFFFTSLLGSVLLVSTGRTALVEATVTMRTGDLERLNAQLDELNASLEARVSERTLQLENANAEQRATAEALRVSNERFDLAARGANDGIWDWNILTGVDWFSDRWCELLGYAPGELAPRTETWESLLHPEDRAPVFAAVAAHLESRAPYNIEYRMQHRDGVPRWFQARGQAVWDENGRAVRMAGSLKDITARKEAEQEIQQLNAGLEARVAERTRELARINEELHGEVAARHAAEAQITASLREKETLLKEIHHRVKNNLQIVSSMLNLRARSGVTPEMGTMLRECQDRIRSMSILHETLYRSDSLASVDLGKYLQGVVSTLRRFHSTERVELHCAMEPITGDADTAIPLGLIVNELATNAFKHAFPDGRSGRVTISLQHDRDGGLELNVRDDGAGPPAGLDLARPNSFGLRLVQIFVKQLNGRFTWSGDESGTAFQVRVSRSFRNPTPCKTPPKSLQPTSS